ncbi:MAG: aquaporin [Acidobacteria bacterium]|nr:MAG: aquaporin [Acidobacteriota bacterium]
MHGHIFGELVGTFVLMLLGDGVVANVVLNRSKGQNSGWIIICSGWGFAVTAAIFCSIAVGGVAHLNAAVTCSLAMGGAFPWGEVPGMLAAELIGSFLGAIVVWLAYLPHWAETDNPPGKLAVFCTAPAIRNIPANALCEVIGTFMLCFIGFSFGAKAFAGLAPGYGPFLWGILVWVIGCALGGPTGFAINPNRDLGPRIAHAILPIPGKGGSDWGYALVPVIGPLIGGSLAGLVTKMVGIL